MSKQTEWLNAQKDNYPTQKMLEEYKPEILLKWWFNCWSNKDPQEYQDMDWDWEIEIQKFIDDPILKTQEAIIHNPEICVCCGDVKEDYIEAVEEDIKQERENEKKEKSITRIAEEFLSNKDPGKNKH